MGSSDSVSLHETRLK